MSFDMIKLLRKTPIFSTLDSASLKKISGFFKERNFSSGEIIFKEGTLGDTLFIIKEGAIKISQIDKEGEEETGQTLRREGDIFGESGFLDESPRPVTVQATKETKVLQLSRSDFLTILNDHPLVAYQIVKVLSARLKQSDLRAIEELKEKNEQLQKAYHALQQAVDLANKQGWLDQASVPERGKKNLSDPMLSSIPCPLVCTQQDDLIVFFNEPAEREFGYKSEEVMGKPIGGLWSETFWSRLSPDIQREIKEKSFWEGEIIAKKKNGEHFLSSVLVSEILDPKKESQGKLFFCWNTTPKKTKEIEEKRRDEQILRQEVKRHITNTIEKKIDVLSDGLEILPLELDEVNLSKILKTLTLMRSALNYMKSFIPNKTVLHMGEVKKESIDLTSFLEQELLLLKSQDKFRGIVFSTHFEPGTPKVEGNRTQLQQMLYVLLDNSTNALKSVSDRVKTITIEVGHTNKEREVQIQISDNGVGISPANLSKVFNEPFTTKKDGLGLGLLSVARIVKSHGGKIEVESDEGTYTLFVIKFPAYAETSAFPPQVQTALNSQI